MDDDEAIARENKGLQPLRQASGTVALARHTVSASTAAGIRFFVERDDVEATRVVPRAELNEMLGGLELGTERPLVSVLPSELDLGAADLLAVGSNPRSNEVGSLLGIVIHGKSVAPPNVK